MKFIVKLTNYRPRWFHKAGALKIGRWYAGALRTGAVPA